MRCFLSQAIYLLLVALLRLVALFFVVLALRAFLLPQALVKISFPLAPLHTSRFCISMSNA
jgi:hypothetical protein